MAGVTIPACELECDLGTAERLLCQEAMYAGWPWMGDPPRRGGTRPVCTADIIAKVHSVPASAGRADLADLFLVRRPSRRRPRIRDRRVEAGSTAMEPAWFGCDGPAKSPGGVRRRGG
jgi:hypothetical protein